MKTTNTEILQDNKIFLWISLGTAFLLLVPFIAMQYNREVNWTLSDFIIAGGLISGSASLFVLLARKYNKQKVIIGAILLFLFLWLWAELAVGVFTNWGS